MFTVLAVCWMCSLPLLTWYSGKPNGEGVSAMQVKAEIQALSSFGFQYLSQVYLPLKLQEGDWI